MLDKEQALVFVSSLGMVSTPHPLPIDLIKAQLGDAYAAFSPAEQEKHLELLRSLPRPEDIALEMQPTTAALGRSPSAPPIN